MSDRNGVAAIILAAGASTRLGRPKQTVELDGETLVERAVRIAQEAALSPVIVVIAREGDFGHALQQRGCLVVINETAREGMGTSIRRGIQVAAMLKAEGAVIMTCDQPALSAAHLCSLTAQREMVSGSAYAGKIGVPAYFPASSFPDLLKLEGDTGARRLLVDAKAIATEELALDVDTEDDLAAARAWLEQQERGGVI